MIRFRLDSPLKDCGWTANRLSKESGIHPSVILKYRHNKVKSASLKSLDAICKALRCQAGDLIEYVAEDRKASKKVGSAKLSVWWVVQGAIHINVAAVQAFS